MVDSLIIMTENIIERVRAKRAMAASLMPESERVRAQLMASVANALAIEPDTAGYLQFMEPVFDRLIEKYTRRPILADPEFHNELLHPRTEIGPKVPTPDQPIRYTNWLYGVDGVASHANLIC